MIENVFLSQAAWQQIILEAVRDHRTEAGGLLIGRHGYTASGALGALVTHATDGGENAVRTSQSFQIDFEASQRRLESIARESGSGYLGQWHSHPTGGAALSAGDRCAYEKAPYLVDALPVLFLVVGNARDGNADGCAMRFYCYDSESRAFADVPVNIV